MNTVRRRAQSLRDAIEESEIYAVYASCEAQIHSDEALQKKLNTYRKELFKLQNSEDAPDQASFTALEKQYSDLLQDVRVIRFLSAERALMDMIDEVFEIVGSIRVDLDFLENE